ncbi:hypothetical protein LWF15_32280 [Kineosporia rhizophila]|uniref:hypothetical protein n=1 Tax=Kineosporia rhizophila TaxID=84633 RepID=UPI001E5BD39F|nr:hypothetical protein [Kineosporia rhizophila]MCE0540182.1 hypothetical protein [Kineosporia rhizophila]
MSMRIGWGDESGSDSARDPNTYILAAVVTGENQADQVRDTMRLLLLRGQRKLHWHDEQDKRRRLISETVATLPVTAVVVVRSTGPGEAMERRRRKCMERMLSELSECGQTEIIEIG